MRTLLLFIDSESFGFRVNNLFRRDIILKKYNLVTYPEKDISTLDRRKKVGGHRRNSAKRDFFSLTKLTLFQFVFLV